MADPLNNFNKCLLLSSSSFVLVVFVSIIFIRCTSQDANSIVTAQPINQALNKDGAEVKRESASFADGLNLKYDGTTSRISATSMVNNFIVKSVKATVKGTSSVHDWESTITKVNCNSPAGSKEEMNDLVVKIPVKGIKGKEGKKMDEKTYEAFKAEQFPFITYSFQEIQVAIDNNRNVKLDTNGTLNMAGVSKPISMFGTGKVLDNGDYQIAVSRKIKMTDFNIEPPTMVLGTIKVGDEISVVFDFILSKLK